MIIDKQIIKSYINNADGNFNKKSIIYNIIIKQVDDDSIFFTYKKLGEISNYTWHISIASYLKLSRSLKLKQLKNGY